MFQFQNRMFDRPMPVRWNSLYDAMDDINEQYGLKNGESKFVELNSKLRKVDVTLPAFTKENMVFIAEFVRVSNS